jgi:hypothetical protein
VRYLWPAWRCVGLFIWATFACTGLAEAQSASGSQSSGSATNADINAANNPLTPKATVYLQNYFIPDLNEVDGRSANQLLLRGVMPSDAFGLPQLLRFKLSSETVPTAPTGTVNGFGDLTLYDLFLLPTKGVDVGIGPLLVAPTATSPSTGDGKWQAGLAAIVASTKSWGLLSGFVTYQHSFAGEGGRPTAEVVTAQPILTRNIADGYYVRSSGIWTFNIGEHTSVIPIGLGLGRIWTFGSGDNINAFVEPQYSVLREGAGVAVWQIFAGLNIQFALGSR